METGSDSVEIEDSKASFKDAIIRFIVTRYYMWFLLWLAVVGFEHVFSVHVFRIPYTLNLITYFALGVWYFNAREKVVSGKGLDSVEIEDSKASFKDAVIRFIVTRYYMLYLLFLVVGGFEHVFSVHVFRIPYTLNLLSYFALGVWYFGAREKVVSDKGGS